MKVVKKLLLLALFFVALDRFLFGYVIWKLPNETPWATNYFFNFLYNYKQVKESESKKPLVLLVGSSIVFYSFDRRQVEQLLAKKFNREFRLEYFSYPGMTPIDAYLLYDKISALKPALVIYPLNFIDYRIHRYYLRGREKKPIDDLAILKDALDFGEAPQSKSLFPLAALQNYYDVFSPQKSATYLAAYLFLSYRYKGIYYKNIKLNYNHRFGRNTSYHGYTGVQLPERINYLGWTSGQFSFVPHAYMASKGFYIQVVPEILNKGPLCLSFTDLRGQEVQKKCFTRVGWQKVVLSELALQQKMLRCRLSSTWIPKLAHGDRFDYAQEPLGVRLQQTFGLSAPRRDIYFQREERLRDLRFQGMRKEGYEAYFHYRLLQDPEKRPGIAYLHAIWESKKYVAQTNFTPNLHFRYLQKWLSKCQQGGFSVMLINHPENPIALRLYENSLWYQKHLQYLQKQAQHPQTYFYDLRKQLSSLEFADFHHVTYAGMRKMGIVLADKVEESQVFTRK
ncbi:MAG: hypothetical protein AAF518_01270 [Spirochaetota bacterium]